MKKNKLDDTRYNILAKEMGLDRNEIKRAVSSFFGALLYEARRLPFNEYRKIYSKEAFDEYVTVINIPSIGRIGPVYSRYLTWRANEAKYLSQKLRSDYRTRISQNEIEHIADDILSGRTPASVYKKKRKELYNNVWLVGKNSKKLARQVIPKEEE